MAKRLRLVLVLAITALAACGPDEVGNEGTLVGGACIDSRDCEFDCQRSGDYPQGTCTVPCDFDEDCPSGTFCIDTEGGVCLLGCDFPEDCRVGYTCKGRPSRGRGGEALVCSN
ncbi:MAG TPA: hypothetical protein VNO30_03135 [Kofleriaceae bacterium]|nr:hypothetical protein [Kofleriaceae bacterium]